MRRKELKRLRESEREDCARYSLCSLVTAKATHAPYVPCAECALFTPGDLPKASAWQKVADLDW